MSDTAASLTEEIKLRMERAAKPVPVGVSARHVHLTREDFKTLCGADAEATKYRELKQPGQFACNEVFTIEGEKGKIERVRMIGPYRKQSQVEISLTDSFKLGVKPPVRDSGKLDATPGVKVTGPKGSITLKNGTIVAKRHIHFSNADAAAFKVKDGQMVRVRAGAGTERELVFEQVLCRVSDQYALEFHADADEANAALLKSGDTVIIA